MSDVILKVEGLSKQYRLGTIGTGTISHDLNRWWYRIRGKEDPYLKIGETNFRDSIGKSPYVWALKDVSFDVRQGEIIGIIGKNGAGKSTLLKILSRVTSPTKGTIKSKGRIASLLEVGTGFHPEMTGRENIFLNGAILGMSRIEIKSKLDEIISFSGCERYIDTPVKRYSSGMTVRLAFAVAAHLEPDILVIDEVLAVGDAEFQKKAIGKMEDISKGEGRTVLFVSHNMGRVRQLCQKVIILNNGEIKFKGGVDEGINAYLEFEHFESYDFKASKDRRGKGDIRIVNLEVFNSEKSIVKLNRLVPLEDYTFQLTLFNRSSTDKRIKVGFSIYTRAGTLLTQSGSECFMNSIEIISGEQKKINVYIPSLPLNHGDYILNLSCNSELGGLEEYIKDSIVFSVEKKFVHPNPILLQNEIVLFNHQWHEA